MKKIGLIAITLLLILTGCGSKTNVMSSYKDFNVKNNHFESKKYSELVDDMINKVPGIYYVGFADCPWCRDLVPVFEEVLAENDMKAMYLDVYDPQFTNNEALKEKYLEFIKTFDAGIANDGKSPFTFVIYEDGTIKGHTGTAPNHDALVAEMTEQEVEYLKVRLNGLLEGLK